EASVSWVYRHEPHQLGYYDASGAVLMPMGRDASFDTTTPTSTFRMLLRFWGGTIASLDRYFARVDDERIGRAIAVADIPVLALVGMWLQRMVERDVAGPGGMAG